MEGPPWGWGRRLGDPAAEGSPGDKVTSASRAASSPATVEGHRANTEGLCLLSCPQCCTRYDRLAPEPRLKLYTQPHWDSALRNHSGRVAVLM